MKEAGEQGLSGVELVALVQRVFRPRQGEGSIALLVDLPDARVPDDADWAARRALARDWFHKLAERAGDTGLEARLYVYRNAHTNNGELPGRCWRLDGAAMPARAEDLDGAHAVAFDEVFREVPLFVAPTEFSATAPLKNAARRYQFRAATMPGFAAGMIPALRLDYGEVNRRVSRLKSLVDLSTEARLRFVVDGERACDLRLDLRHRVGHASGGLLPEPGHAGNLPSGEAYIVPYEGEDEADPSRSEGTLPVQFGDEVLFYEIRENRAVSVEGEGEKARAEAALLAREPAYGNIAELGLGVLDDFGLAPCGEILLDEKLGLHIAFGRSDHFGGIVGPGAFTAPEEVIHLDRVYIPEVQPLVKVLEVQLHGAEGPATIMVDGQFSGVF